MTRDADTLLRWAQGCLIIATIFSNMYPIMYAFSPWHKSALGRIIMFKAIAFAMALNITLLFQFWHPEDLMVLYLIDAVVFTFIAITTASVTYMVWKLNYSERDTRTTQEKLMETEQNNQPKGPFLTNRLYDALKFVAQIFLPALGTLYFTLAGVWELPYAEQVVGTIVAVDTFLGVLLGLSTKQYEQTKYDGEVNVVPDEVNQVTDLNFKITPDVDKLAGQKEIVLKVNRP